MQELSRTKEPEQLGDPAFGKLTAREKDILAEIAAGKSNQEIASQLYISENTVKYHIRNILQKLAVQNRTEAVALAFREGFIEHK